LFVNTGGFIDEEQIEKNFSNEGYLILHPERHDFTFCMSVYSGAKKIVLPEGGAVAPAVFAAKPEARILVLRRGALHSTSITLPAFLHGFSGRQGIMLDCIGRFFMMQRTQSTQTPRVYVEVDHQIFARYLFDNGFIENPDGWVSSSIEKLMMERTAIEKIFNRKLHEVSRKAVVERDGRFSFWTL
jgi:hypothetical protein